MLLSATGLSAQSVTGGLKAGANITNFTDGDFGDVKKSALVGFHAGGYLNFGIGAFSIQPELLVSTSGAKLETIDGDKEDFRLTYLTVPVMAKFKTPAGIYLELGPQVGFKLSEDVGESTIDNFAKNLDLSAGAGIGFNVGKIGIGGRYLVGLSKVGDFDDSDINPDFKNSTIQIGLSFRL